MTAYLAWWFAGGAVGLTAAALVLRRRGELDRAAVCVFAAAAFGCLYGAKLQYRLRFEPLWSALAVPPDELLAPGFHIPLGLVSAFIAATIVARLMRRSPLPITDALTLAGAVMMPIGRIGCLIAGCCTGAVCPAWWPLGVTRGPDSSAFAQQLLAGVIGTDAQSSLPVHPLPLYFALLGIATAVVEVGMIRRRARAGAVTAFGFLAYPTGQLVIEQLRSVTESRGAVMTAVLIGTIVCDLVVVLVLRRRAVGVVQSVPRDEGGMPLATTAVLGLAVTVALSLGSGVRADVPTANWADLLPRYVRDPVATRRAILAIGRHADDSLAPIYRMVLADAQLRAGHLRTAGRMFEDIMADDTTEAWHGMAAVGRGWVAVSRGRFDEARTFFAGASEVGGSTAQLGDFMVGMIDAGRGDADALDRFARIANDPDTPDGLRSAAAMATGYSHLWSGDNAAAARAFDDVAGQGVSDAMSDEARYASALTRWRDGDPRQARADLKALADAQSPGRAQASAGVMSLDPRALIRASARKYRKLPLRLPIDQVTSMMRLDVHQLARVALRRLDAGQPPPRLTILQAERPATTAAAAPRSRREPKSSSPTARPVHDEPTFPVASLVGAAGLLGATLWAVFASRSPRRS